MPSAAFLAASLAAAASSAKTATRSAFGSAGALRAPRVVVFAEEAALAEDAAKKATDDTCGKAAG